MKIQILSEIEKIQDKIIALRRDFHKHPELGFNELRTADKIAKQLESYDIAVKRNIGKTGVVGDLVIDESFKTIALRADMDALPIQETSNIGYKSVNDGIMHACGHDGHMAMLLGAAEVLSKMRDKLGVNVRFIFQPAEEGEGGARYMIADGALDNVEAIYGIHLWNYQPFGEIGIKSDSVMAAADIIDIEIEGIGGHGAAPQGTVDAIVVASNLIMSFQSIISRNVDPLHSGVITIGEISGGHGFNIIANKVKLRGTVRAMTEENRQLIKSRMEEIIEGTEKTYKAKISMDYQDGYPPTVNHKTPTELIHKAAVKITGANVKEPYLSMGAEDFSYYLQEVPGSFIFIGSAPEGSEPMSIPHHCSHFDIDEKALLVGSSVFVQLIKDYSKL